MRLGLVGQRLSKTTLDHMVSTDWSSSNITEVGWRAAGCWGMVGTKEGGRTKR